MTSNQILNLLKQKGVSEKSVAKVLRIPKERMQQFRTGEAQFDVREVSEIAFMFDLGIYFFYWQDTVKIKIISSEEIFDLSLNINK